MGQTQSTPMLNTGVQKRQHLQQQNHSNCYLGSFREEQLKELRTQLARLADALTFIEVSRPECHSVADTSADEAGNSVLSHVTESLPPANTSAFPLQPFAQVHLAGYQLGDEALTTPLSLSTDRPSRSPLSFFGLNTALAVLDLSYNHLTSAILNPLLHAVATLPALTVLKLSGNAIGSAFQNADDSASKAPSDATHTTEKRWGANNGVLSLVEDSTSEAKSSSVTKTAAAQLGRWLATNPPLQELFLYQCELDDYDVQALLRGLIPAKGEASKTLRPSSSSLVLLQLAGNPACTWRSAQLLLELLTEMGNTSLSIVELEGAPPATEVRFEYACSPAGHFRSGKTLVSVVDGGGKHDEEPEKNTETVSGSLTEEQWRAMTPGQLARFRSRRRHLRDDLDGTRVMLPALMEKINSILSARRAATTAVAAKTPAGGSTHVDRASRTAADKSVTQGLRENYEISGKKEQDEGVHVGVTEGDKPNTTNKSAAAATATVGGHSPHADSASPSAALSTPHKPNAADQVPSPPKTPPRFLTSSHTHWSPQERRAARFETPARIAAVMADARAFRRHVHPLRVDTHAPACAEVRTRSTSGLNGSESTAATWYAQEGFVLRPNGMSRVLVAPVLSGAASARRNVLLEDVEDRPLQACWCTPRSTLNGVTCAGTLHYHCVREGDPVKHQGGAVMSARLVRRQKRATKQQHLPPLAAAAGSAVGVGAIGAHTVRNTGRAYLACSGTGHTCLSAAVASHSPLRTQRMRTTLLTQSEKQNISSYGARSSSAADVTHGGTRLAMSLGESEGRVGEADSLMRRAPPHKRTPSALSSSKASESFGHNATMFGGAKTIHTTSSGLSVALNYSPVAFFAGPHVSCAAGIQVEECT